MPTELFAALALILAVVGVCGIVIPVLPGTITVAAGLLVWALAAPAPWGWVVAAVGWALLAVGATAQYLITGRRLRARDIPNRSVVIGLIAGVVGMVVIPFVGLFVGFIAGLFGAELVRVRDARAAASTSWAALKSVGLGMAVELACAVTALGVLLTGVLVHFFA